MIVTDPTSGKHLGILMIFSYALTSDAFETRKSEFEDVLTTVINRRSDGDVTVSAPTRTLVLEPILLAKMVSRILLLALMYKSKRSDARMQNGSVRYEIGKKKN